MLKGQMVTGIHLKISFYELCAAGLIILAVALRIVLVYLGWPGMDSDEGTMGLMALHLTSLGCYPVAFSEICCYHYNLEVWRCSIDRHNIPGRHY